MAELTQEQVDALQALIAQGKPAPVAVASPAPVAEPAGFNLRLGGNSYTVRDQDEAQRLLDQYDAQRAQEVESERIRATALEQQQQRIEATLPSRQGDGFSKDEYARLFLDDPRKAQRYMLQHDPEQIQFYGGLVNQINALKQEQAGTQFLLQHKNDYVPTPQNFAAINKIISDHNLPWDINGMNLAFSVGRGLGLITSPEAEWQAEGDPGDEQEQVAVAPPPRVSRRRSSQNQAASENSQIMAEFENLSPDKMKQYLESLAR